MLFQNPQRSAPLAFCFLSLVFGSCYALWAPPLRGPDEGGHFRRAYTVSTGHCLAAPAILTSADWNKLDASPWEELPNATPKSLAALVDTPGYSYDRVGMFAVQPLYSCVPYLASATGIAVARAAGLPMLRWMYSGRIANLIAYSLLVALALHLLPEFHSLLMALALMPMALHQAASLSADCLQTASVFLFTAYVLRLALDSSVATLAPRQKGVLLAGLAVVSLIKSNGILSVLVLLIPEKKFRSRLQRLLFAALCFAISGASVLGWARLNRSNQEICEAIRAAHGIHMASNARIVIEHPGLFFGAFARTLWRMRFEYPLEFVGKFGSLEWPVPTWVVVGYLALLLCCLLGLQGRTRFTPWNRVVLVALGAAYFVILGVVVWTFEVTQPYLYGRILEGRGYVEGIQGRYLVGMAFPVLIGLSWPLLKLDPRHLYLILMAGCVVFNVAALLTLHRAFPG
jgi:uncharacterized membrane protein